MTTVVIPDWFPYLILYALCTGLLLGLEHEAFWPGKNVTNPLPVWATQIMGTATLWVGSTAFFVIELHTWAPPLIFAVFIAFGGLFPLTLRFWRWIKAKFHKLNYLEGKEAHE